MIIKTTDILWSLLWGHDSIIVKVELASNLLPFLSFFDYLCKYAIK